MQAQQNDFVEVPSIRADDARFRPRMSLERVIPSVGPSVCELFLPFSLPDKIWSDNRFPYCSPIYMSQAFTKGSVNKALHMRNKMKDNDVM